MTKHEKEIGYELCKECESGIHLKESGFVLETHICSQCKCFVADKDDFLSVNLDVEILSK